MGVEHQAEQASFAVDSVTDKPRNIKKRRRQQRCSRIYFNKSRLFGDKEAAIWARYLEDKVSPEVADQYRGAVFAAQSSITSKDDMAAFTRRFFSTHGLKLPFVPDPTGELAKEVAADKALGDRLGIKYTACIIVCTQREWVHVTDIRLLNRTIDELEASVKGATAKPVEKKRARS